MRLPAMCHYAPGLVILSVLLAIVISFVAMWLAFGREREKAKIAAEGAITIDNCDRLLPIEPFLKEADAALYQPKASGRNRVVYAKLGAAAAGLLQVPQRSN